MVKWSTGIPHRVPRRSDFICGSIALLILCGALAGCQRPKAARDVLASSATTEPIVFPELGAAQGMEAGIVRHEVVLGTGPLAGKVWVYLPEKPGGTKLPTVLIAPAGSTLMVGMNLEQGDVLEHLPYVRAGFAVVAFAIAGGLPDIKHASDAQHFAAMPTFMAAEAGLVNARRALDFALARVPQIDPDRIYTAGHSSAATLSLLVAEQEPRVKACIAFAPAPDVVKRLGRDLLRQLDQKIPGFAAFIERTSPLTGVAHLHCPLFLFQAQDDTVTPIVDSVAFVNEARKTNARVTFVQWPRGGHYQSMIQEGIPQAIRWLRTLPAQ